MHEMCCLTNFRLSVHRNRDFWTDANVTGFLLRLDWLRLWVNGQPIINNWTDHGPTENNGTIALIASQKYDVRLKFYENAGGASSVDVTLEPSKENSAVVMQRNPAGSVRTIQKFLFVHFPHIAQRGRLNWVPDVTRAVIQAKG